jgi:hypothetical protein
VRVCRLPEEQGQGAGAPSARIHVRRLMVVDWVWDPRGGGSARRAGRLCPFCVPRAPLRALRLALVGATLALPHQEAAAAAAAPAAGAEASRGRPLTLLWISRNDIGREKRRRVSNEGQLLAAAERLVRRLSLSWTSGGGGGGGGVSWQLRVVNSSSLAALPMRDTARLFQAADVVCGLHGGALSNILFLPPSLGALQQHERGGGGSRGSRGELGPPALLEFAAGRRIRSRRAALVEVAIAAPCCQMFRHMAGALGLLYYGVDAVEVEVSEHWRQEPGRCGEHVSNTGGAGAGAETTATTVDFWNACVVRVGVAPLVTAMESAMRAVSGD